jgi:hypothetical protein
MLSRSIPVTARTHAAARRRGIASVLAMLYMTIFAALALGFYAATNMSSQISSNEKRTIEAQLAVESGIQFLQYHLNAVNIPATLTVDGAFEELHMQLQGRLEGTGNLGTKTLGYRPTEPGKPGEIRIPDLPTDTIPLTPGGPGFRAVITAGDPTISVKFTGAAKGGAAARAARLQFKRGPRPSVLVGINSLTLKGAAFTDSYDASVGNYDLVPHRALGTIGSNGPITLADTAKVFGDVRFGTTLTTAPTAKINGMAAALASPGVYPSVAMPKSGTYTDLGDVNNSSGTQSPAGGTYMINNLTLSGTAQINWKGPVKLYIKTSYNVSGGVVINTHLDLPVNRKIFFLPTCKTATWSGSNKCVGDLYAPDTDFTVSGTVQKHGRIIAKSITNSSTGGMHADESLPTHDEQITFTPMASTYLEVAP